MATISLDTSGNGYQNIDFSAVSKIIATSSSGFTGDYYTDGANDEIQIQAAIDAVTATGGVVFLRKGTYIIQAKIVIKDNVTLRGEGWGTILSGLGTTNFPIIERIATSGTPSRNWVIEDLKIDGTNVSTAAYSTSTKGIFTQYSVDCRMSNLYVYNTSATGIGTDFMVRCVIENCIVDSCGRQFDGGVGSNGIGIGTAGFEEESLSVTNCHAINVGNCGIMFEGQVNDNNGKYMHAVNCTAQGCKQGFANLGAKRVAFIGCSAMENTANGFDISEAYTGATADECVIDGCFSEENTLAGVNIAGANTRRLTITNSFISSNTTNGIKLTAGSRIIISDNQIHTNARSGINFTSATVNLNNVSINDNQIFNNGTAGTAADDDGILLTTSASGSISDIQIHDNRLFDNQGTETQDTNIHIVGTNTRVSIENNNVDDPETTAIAVDTASATAVIRNNIGYNPIGASTASISSSPYTYVAGNSPETLYISLGSVTAIAKNSLNLFSSTEKSVNLEPNESVIVTYASVPTIIRDIH